MELNDMFRKKDIDPHQVLVLRHQPREPRLRKVLAWLAAEKPDVFNAYQQTQGEKVEKAFQRAKYVASCIGHAPRKALFVGLYSSGGSHPITREEYWQVPAYAEMGRLGMEGFTVESERKSCLWFDLVLTDFYDRWRGRLIVDWPPPERAWWRLAHRNAFSFLALLEDSALVPAMLEWDKIVLKWEELPMRWRSALSQWRGIYYILDTSDGKGYVGSAYGASNLLGRWVSYAASGHGGNALLRKRDPNLFRFSILQRVSPDMDASDVIGVENTWKDRLHTRQPHGLNDN
jgi:hypothetical protein